MNKPVAWMYEDASGTMKMLGNTQFEEWVTKFGCKEIPLYTNPVKELTDEEIIELTPFKKHPYDEFVEYEKEDLIEFAKAILRKANEK